MAKNKYGDTRLQHYLPVKQQTQHMLFKQYSMQNITHAGEPALFHAGVRHPSIPD